MRCELQRGTAGGGHCESADSAIATRAGAAAARAGAFVAALAAVRASCGPPAPASPAPPSALFDCVDLDLRLIRADTDRGVGDATHADWEPAWLGEGGPTWARGLSSESVRLDSGADPSWAATLLRGPAAAAAHVFARGGGGDGGCIGGGDGGCIAGGDGDCIGGGDGDCVGGGDGLARVARTLSRAAGHIGVPMLLGYCGGTRGGGGAMLLHAFPYATAASVRLVDNADRAAPARATARTMLAALYVSARMRIWLSRMGRRIRRIHTCVTPYASRGRAQVPLCAPRAARARVGGRARVRLRRGRRERPARALGTRRRESAVAARRRRRRAIERLRR